MVGPEDDGPKSISALVGFERLVDQVTVKTVGIAVLWTACDVIVHATVPPSAPLVPAPPSVPVPPSRAPPLAPVPLLLPVVLVPPLEPDAPVAVPLVPEAPVVPVLTPEDVPAEPLAPDPPVTPVVLAPLDEWPAEPVAPPEPAPLAEPPLPLAPCLGASLPHPTRTRRALADAVVNAALNR